MGKGGGGGSGKSDWPDYMKNKHEAWLSAVDALIPGSIAANPYTGIAAYDPATLLMDMETKVTAFSTALTIVTDPGLATLLGTFIASVKTNVDAALLNEAYITNQSNKYLSSLVAQKTAKLIPIFESGMRDINAVMTSSFVLGEYAIAAEVTRETALFEANLRIELGKQRNDAIKVLSTSLLDLYLKHTAMRGDLAKLWMDVDRLSIIANKEEIEQQTDYDVQEARWPYDLYMYGGNMLSSIGGGHGGADTAMGPSKTQSAMSGAIAGATIGAGFGGVGAIAGAVIGGVAGYAMAS
jgi:hypothetical protein